MKKIALWSVSALLLGAASISWAATAVDVGNALMDARANLVAMLGSANKAEQEALHAKITAASAKVDEAVAAILADKATPADTAAKLTEFNTVWGEFKKTRENEIVPAVYAGKMDDAKALAKGIQAERIKQMKAILTGLGWTEAVPAAAPAK